MQSYPVLFVAHYHFPLPGLDLLPKQRRLINCVTSNSSYKCFITICNCIILSNLWILFLKFLTNLRERFLLFVISTVKMKAIELGGQANKTFYYTSSSLNYQANLQDDLVLKNTFINLVDPQFNIIPICSSSWDNVSQTPIISNTTFTSLLYLHITYTNISIYLYVNFKSTPFSHFAWL